MFFESIDKLYKFHRHIDMFVRQQQFLSNEIGEPKDTTRLPKFINLKETLVRDCYSIFNDSNFIAKENEAFIFFDDYKVPLEVKRVQFNSPGSVDFIGLGKIFQIVSNLIKHYIPNKNTKLKNDEQNIENKSKELANELTKRQIEDKDLDLFQKKMQVLKDLGLSTTEVRAVLGMEALELDNFRHLALSGKVVEIEVKGQIKKTN